MRVRWRAALASWCSRINLAANNLVGTLPKSLSGLRKLTYVASRGSAVVVCVASCGVASCRVMSRRAWGRAWQFDAMSHRTVVADAAGVRGTFVACSFVSVCGNPGLADASPELVAALPPSW